MSKDKFKRRRTHALVRSAELVALGEELSAMPFKRGAKRSTNVLIISRINVLIIIHQLYNTIIRKVNISKIINLLYQQLSFLLYLMQNNSASSKTTLQGLKARYFFAQGEKLVI